jgi:hypothetical protein
MTSFLRTHVFTANIARIARVTPRTRGSSKVLIASTAIAAYANSANNNLFDTTKYGAQGRIRTFVPRKEEQIYSLPALTTHPPVHLGEQRAWSFERTQLARDFAAQLRQNLQAASGHAATLVCSATRQLGSESARKISPR